MKFPVIKYRIWSALILAGFSPLALAADTTAVSDEWRWLTFAVFAVIIGITMYVTYLAAMRVKTATQFYAAGRSVSGIQNGWAIAGDYLSAASFLGIAGLISLYGYDGFMYSVGWLVAYITVLLVIAEPCRNIGKYTLGDVLAFRNDPKKAKTVAAIATITVSIFYLTAQMVGGGVLVKTLVGIDYEISVIAVGVVMLMYVLFGGMVATTWVQIIKAILLVAASLIMVFFTWLPYGFSLPGFLQAVVGDADVQQQVAKLLGDAAKNMTAEELGQRFLEPGLFLKNPIDQISLGMALVLGTAGMPHILMRFFTVPNAKAARVSVIWAMAIIGGFYVLTLFLGSGSAIFVGATEITRIDKGGNMAGPLLAQYIGGGRESFMGNFLLAFVAAVAFATIVAVVAGLVLASASAMSHDIWVGVIKGEHATQEEEIRAARISSVIVGAAAIAIGIMAKGQNVAHLVALAFAVAASSNLPAVLMTLYWKRCNTGGIMLAMIVGAFSAIALVMISPNVTYPKAVKDEATKVIEGTPATAEIAAQPAEWGLMCEFVALASCKKEVKAQPAKPAAPGTKAKIAGLEPQLAVAADPSTKAKLEADLAKLKADQAKAEADLKKFADTNVSLVGLEKPFFLLKNPGLFSIPLGFLCILIGSLLYRDRRAEEMWEELYVRQNTGLHAEAAAAH